MDIQSLDHQLIEAGFMPVEACKPLHEIARASEEQLNRFADYTPEIVIIPVSLVAPSFERQLYNLYIRMGV